jgi:hypothetical protein
MQRDYLSVDVCDINIIIIYDCNRTDTCPGQRFRTVPADSADSEKRHMRMPELFYRIISNHELRPLKPIFRHINTSCTCYSL